MTQKKDEEKNMEKKTTKVSMETQFKNSNIENYSKQQLVYMVNLTSGEADFSNAFPEATFGRNLTIKYLEKKYDMDFIGRSYVLPHGVTIHKLLETYENLNGTQMDSKESSIKSNVEPDVDIVCIPVGEIKKKKSLSMRASTMKKWEDFVSGTQSKSDFLTAACEYFMKCYNEGRVKMEAVWKNDN